MKPKKLKRIILILVTISLCYFELNAQVLEDKKNKQSYGHAIEMGTWISFGDPGLLLKPEYYFKSKKFLPYIGLIYYSYQYEINGFPIGKLGTNNTTNIGIVFGVAKNVFSNNIIKIDLGLEDNIYNTDVNVKLNDTSTRKFSFYSNSIFFSSRFNITLSRKLLIGPRIDLGYGYGFIKSSDYNDGNLTNRDNSYYEIRYYIGIKYLLK